MRQLLVSSSPHIKTRETVPTVMWAVVLALLPAWIAGVYFYGLPALLLGLVCMALCMLIEYCIVYIRTKPDPLAAIPRADGYTLAAGGVVSAREVALAEKKPDALLKPPEQPKGFFHSHRHKRAWLTATDGSAAITGLLFAMTLKPNTLYWFDETGAMISEWYVVVFGCVFAIALAKQLFGGLGCNIWNPALAARAFVQISYGKEVNGKFLEPFAWSADRSGAFFDRVSHLTSAVPAKGVASGLGVDAISQSTPLEWYKQGKVVWSMTLERAEAIKDALKISNLQAVPDSLAFYFQHGGDLKAAGLADRIDPAHVAAASDTVYSNVWTNLLDMLPNHWLGGTAGSMGETSAVLLLLGGLFLWARGYLDWRVPIGFLATVALLCLVVPYKGGFGFSFLKPEHLWYKPAFHLAAGGLMLGAWFMATDMVSSPVSKSGNLIFGIGCGVLTVVIRNFAAYPEGVCYAILIMNTATPIIDRFTKPRVFGTKLPQSPKEAAKK